jgi:hypothetical protein
MSMPTSLGTSEHRQSQRGSNSFMSITLPIADLFNSDFNVYGAQMRAFTRSNAEVVCSNPTRGTDVCGVSVFVLYG